MLGLEDGGMVTYAEASRAVQIRRLAKIARSAIPAWGLGDAELRLLNHGYNTIFRVSTGDGRRFALRINTQPHKEKPHLQAELAWLSALAAETELVVPEPQRTLLGELSVEVPSPDHDRALPAVLFSWVEGRSLGSRGSAAQWRSVGRATANLHRHARDWAMPPGAALPGIDSVLMNVPNRLAGGHPLLSADDQHVLGEAMNRIQAAYDALFSARGHRRPLHADLHGWNLRWHRGRLAILDFDDAGIGVPIQDLAISAYYLRPDRAREEALLEGYAESAPLPDFSAAEFEAVVASRNLVLANDVIATEQADFRALIERYLPTTVARMRYFLDTGSYRPDAPGAEVF